jgi:hypothetical protein
MNLEAGAWYVGEIDQNYLGLYSPVDALLLLESRYLRNLSNIHRVFPQIVSKKFIPRSIAFLSTRLSLTKTDLLGSIATE